MLTQDDIPHRHGVNEEPGFICFQRVVPPAYMRDTTPFWRKSALMWDQERALEWANADCRDQANAGGTWTDDEIKEMGALNWV